jgi:hypothetical protein
MRHDPRSIKRVGFWMLLATALAAGLALFVLVPNHKISGALALGIVAILVLKHVGLLMIVGAPLTGLLKLANKTWTDLLRKHSEKVD